MTPQEDGLRAALARARNLITASGHPALPAYRDGWLDALDSIADEVATPTPPEPLDVERMARALALVHVTNHPIKEAIEHWESFRTDATEIVAAYSAVGDLPAYARAREEK